jgi:hypothetical protein
MYDLGDRLAKVAVAPLGSAIAKRQKNAVKHKKGEPYLVDCNVTGMNAGTPQIPCFPLRSLWEHSLFPAIKALTAPDGPCAGAQVVFQEDNAGPHTNLEYAAWMTEAIAAHGWKIELQAPQG